MKIVGIDPSLSATGLASIVDGIATGTDTIKVPKKSLRTSEDRLARLDEIVRTAHAWAYRSDLVVVEGLAYDAHDNLRQLAGLHWMLCHQLWDSGHRIAVVPPTTLKVFMGLGGRAPKADVTRAARTSFPEVEVDNDNEADALWLAEVGATWLGCPVRVSSPERMSHLRGVVWPTPDLAA